MVDSAELSVDKVPKHLNMSRERQTIILKREQETAVKNVLAGRNVIGGAVRGGQAHSSRPLKNENHETR